MKNYFNRLYALVVRNKTAKEKKPLTVLHIWRIELAIIIILFLMVSAADIWIYHNMVSRDVEALNNKVSLSAVLNKKDIAAAGKRISEHESALNNPTLPLMRNPF